MKILLSIYSWEKNFNHWSWWYDRIELVRQCLKYEPALLVIIDKHENSLMKIEREVLSQQTNVLLKPLLSNVRDFDVLSKIYQL